MTCVRYICDPTRGAGTMLPVTAAGYESNLGNKGSLFPDKYSRHLNSSCKNNPLQTQTSFITVANDQNQRLQ